MTITMVPRRSILVVEDDEDLQQMMEGLLTSNGYSVSVARDGLEALSYLEQNRNSHAPSVILLDLQMPRMSGTEFLERRAADADLARIPVIVLTAAPDPRDALGNLPHLSVLRKPFDLDVLLARVKAASTQRPERT